MAVLAPELSRGPGYEKLSGREADLLREQAKR